MSRAVANDIADMGPATQGTRSRGPWSCSPVRVTARAVPPPGEDLGARAGRAATGDELVAGDGEVGEQSLELATERRRIREREPGELLGRREVADRVADVPSGRRCRRGPLRVGRVDEHGVELGLLGLEVGDQSGVARRVGHVRNLLPEPRLRERSLTSGGIMLDRDLVLPHLLARRAEREPDALAMQDVDGRERDVPGAARDRVCAGPTRTAGSVSVRASTS